VTGRRFISGAAEYIVFVNNYPDRYHGMTYWYGDSKQENDKRAALVRSEPVEARVTITGGKRFLFDMSTGEELGDTGKPLTLNLEPAWGQVIMLLPCESARLNVTGPSMIKQGENALFTLRMGDNAGKAIDASFVARVSVLSPSGRTSRLDGYLGLQSGEADFTLPIGCNEETGDWSLTFEGGFPRKTVTLILRIDQGAAPSLLLNATWK
jgi:hypothetical protein